MISLFYWSINTYKDIFMIANRSFSYLHWFLKLGQNRQDVRHHKHCCDKVVSLYEYRQSHGSWQLISPVLLFQGLL